MSSMKYLNMKSSEDTVIIAHSSCILDKHFFETYTKTGSEEKKLQERQLELFHKKKQLEEENKKEEERKAKELEATK